MATSKSDTGGSPLDTVKLIVALALILAGLGGFYYFSGESTLYRVLGLLAVTALAVGVFVTTAPGRSLVGFLKGARAEVRKMVWPTRQEAAQTTLVVMVLVLLVGIFLWLVDMVLGWGVSHFIGGA